MVGVVVGGIVEVVVVELVVLVVVVPPGEVWPNPNVPISCCQCQESVSRKPSELMDHMMAC